MLIKWIRSAILPPSVQKEHLATVVHLQNEYTFAIVGCGTMGLLIACELLRRGCRIFMYDNNTFRCHSVLTCMKAMLTSHLGRNIDEHGLEMLTKRVYIASDLEEIASSGCNAIIEAVPEALQTKREVVSSIIGILIANAIPPEKIIIFSNTISIPIESIMYGLDDMYSCRLMGLRFLHPVLFIHDVEITKCSRNTDEVLHTTMRILRSMNFKPAVRDRLSGRKLTTTAIWRYWRHCQPTQLTHVIEEMPSSSFGNKSLCMICLDRDASTIVVPCGHQVACKHCALKISRAQDAVLGCLVHCPLCRQDGTVHRLPD
jgi:hypothetical protein